MNFNNTTRKIKETYRNQLEGIISRIERFRNDKALSVRLPIKVLGLKLTICLRRRNDQIEVMFTDENDNFLHDNFGLCISSTSVISNEDDFEKIFKVVSEEVSTLIEEFILS